MKRKKAISQIFTAFFIAASFLLYIPIFADVNSVVITGMVPPNPLPGTMAAVTFDYCIGANEESRLALAVSDASTFRANNTAGQTFKVNETGIDITSATLGGGLDMNDQQGAAHCVIGTVWNITIPATLAEGSTYYIIVGGKYWYTDPGQIASQNFISFTTPPPATGCSITKTAEAVTVRPGDYVLYTIDYNYANANSPTITDTVPLNCTLISQSLGGTNGGTSAGSGLTWAFANTTVRKVGNVWFIVQVDSGAPLSTTIHNTADWSLIDPNTLATLSGSSLDAPINTVSPNSVLKSQSLSSPGVINDTITYTLSFHSGGESFMSLEPFYTDPGAVFTKISGGGGANVGQWTWINAGGGDGYLWSVRQNTVGANYPRYLNASVNDFCFGEIQGDVYIEDNGQKDSLITFRDNNLPDGAAMAYGVGLSSDHNPGDIYIQKSQPYSALMGNASLITQPNTWYTIKINVTDASGTTGIDGSVLIQAKAWPRGGVEPGFWMISATNSTAPLPECGYVGFQGHPDNYNYYDNLKIIKSNPSKPVVVDTVPSIITFVGGDGLSATHSNVSYAGGLVKWNIFSSLTDQVNTLNWWGTVNYCGDAYNKFSVYFADSPMVDSNTTTLNVPVCPQTPTITVTWTSTSTPLPSSTITPTFTRTVTLTSTLTPTHTVTMTPVYYPSISMTKMVNINPARPGDTVIYTIDYYNTGVIPATNVSITDILDSKLMYVAGSSTPVPNSFPPPATQGGTINWIISNIPALTGYGRITFSAVVGTNVVRGDTIPNRVNATCLQSSTPVYSNQHILTLDIPALVLSKRVTVPNPASTVSEIIFNLTVAADVTIKFYTISGELIRTMDKAEVVSNLLHGQTNIRGGDALTGNNSVEWDLTNKDGVDVASGIYFYRVEAVSGAGEKAFFISKLAVLR